MLTLPTDFTKYFILKHQKMYKANRNRKIQMERFYYFFESIFIWEHMIINSLVTSSGQKHISQ